MRERERVCWERVEGKEASFGSIISLRVKKNTRKAYL